MDECLSYREVVPNNIKPDEFVKVEINTGSHHTLQDVKTSERSGGYGYKYSDDVEKRNRFIYWRAYHNVLELSEISLDYSLTNNNIRIRFMDTAVLSIFITEHDDCVVLLVATVSSLHRFDFPLNSTQKATPNSKSKSNESLIQSIFHNVRTNEHIKKQGTCHIVEGGMVLPHTAACQLSPNGTLAYFALACQSKLMLHTVRKDSSNHQLVSQEIKDSYLMPRFLTNLKGALTGRTDGNNFAISLVFNHINNETYLSALYRNDELKVWSTTTIQSVCQTNCIHNTAGEFSQGPQSSMLRKIDEHNLCVFLSHTSFSEFVCVSIVPKQPDGNNVNVMNLVRRKLIPTPKMDLVDYDVSKTCIWALWNNVDGEYNVSNFALRNGSNMNWTSAALEPLPYRCNLSSEQGVDPREAYCTYIFQPGKFDRKVIAKALNMFRRVNLSVNVKQLSISMLKEQVCQAIEDEVQNEIKEFAISDEDYLEVTSRLWERFYSCCEQYHSKYTEPTGIFILNDMDTVCIVRKQQYALLRPCDMLEHLMLVGDEDMDVNAAVNRYFPEEQQVGLDFVKLITFLAQIDKWLPEDIKNDMDRKMYQLDKPSELIAKLVHRMLAGEIMPPNFLVQLRQQLQTVKDLRGAIKTLLEVLRIDASFDSYETKDTTMSVSRLQLGAGTLCSSDHGLSILTETVKHSAIIRLALCRNLLILEQILIDSFSVSVEILESVRTNLMPDTVLYLQAYYVMVWITETPVKLTTPATLESSMQRLHVAQLNSGGRYFASYSKQIESTTLLHLFLKSKGLRLALSLLTATNHKLNAESKLQNTLLPLTACIYQLIWVISFEFTFGEWLFSSCQHVIIQDYVRLLGNWCEWNIYSRQFMLGVLFLDCCELHKAFQLFIYASRGVLKEKFLFDNILKKTTLHERLADKFGPYMKIDEDMNIVNQATAHYYLKTIQLFEQSQALNYIISLAQVAIGLLDRKDPQLPMFHSIVFNNHLLLEHYDEAYHSLIYNADTSRRKDCLRQLIVTLFNRKRLDLLMHFPYGGLYDEFENIVESRARSLTMEQNVVYDFLYSFHANNGNMRKASSIMYEQAMRYQMESDLPNALRKRCSSLLICINAMELTDERYRWIAKPLVGDEFTMSNNSIDEDNDMLGSCKSQEVVVLSVEDVRREFFHAKALSELSKYRKDVHAYANAGAAELSYLLCSCGLFTSALKLVNGFNLNIFKIIESLTAACVRTAEEKVNEAWTWLQENDLADLPHRNKASDMAWQLLEKLIRDNETEDSTQMYKCVVNKLLSLNAFVPQWLYNAYKLKNCPELLFLFIKHNRLLEASELAGEMIEAMLGAGSEYYSFGHPLASGNPTLALPVNSLDLLLEGLAQNDEINYKVAHRNLEEKIKKYLTAVSNTTQEKIKMASRLKAAQQS